jgi:hypothetical protein
MLDVLFLAIAVWVLFVCWPVERQRTGALALLGATFVALPLGWLLIHTSMEPVGWMLLLLAAWVLGRWLLEKWRTQ